MKMICKSWLLVASFVILWNFACCARYPDVSKYRNSNLKITKENDDIFAPIVASDETSNTASVQFMITRKMRGVLQDELGYLPSEVDELDPEVAAILIQKRLERPKQGILDAWRKSSSKAVSRRRQWTQIKKLKQSLAKIYQSSIDFALAYGRPALPMIIALTTVWFQRHVLANIASAVFNSLQHSKLNVFRSHDTDNDYDSDHTHHTRQRLLGIIPNPFSRSQPKVDMKAFERVQRTSIFDRLAMKLFGAK